MAYFYPAIVTCAPKYGPLPTLLINPPGSLPVAPSNTLGGFNGLLDLNDYNGNTGNPSLLISPEDALASSGIRETLNPPLSNPGQPWYVMTQVDFKDWIGVSGIFWKNTDFIMEVDILCEQMPLHGGFRDEAPNSAISSASGPGGANPLVSPYGNSAAQGCGVCLKAVITDPATSLEVVKDIHIFQGIVGNEFGVQQKQTFPRQTVSLNLAGITPAEMLTMVLRIETQQYYSHFVFPPLSENLASVVTAIYRIGLLPDPSALKSSGKQSAAMTSR